MILMVKFIWFVFVGKYKLKNDTLKIFADKKENRCWKTSIL